jgi:hypothetical protein
LSVFELRGTDQAVHQSQGLPTYNALLCPFLDLNAACFSYWSWKRKDLICSCYRCKELLHNVMFDIMFA